MERTAALLLTALLPCLAAQGLAAQTQSRWVHFGDDGKLVYAQTPNGDQIVDFSYAGYRGGGVAIPNWPATLTVKPTGGDDTGSIQAAIDKVSALPLDDHGHRGSVYLAEGVFHLSGTIIIKASGVVLHGAGRVPGKHGTDLVLTGKSHLGINVAGDLKERFPTPPTTLTDAYVPSGATVIHVADASSLHAGDTLQITKLASPAWIAFMGMDKLTRPGRDEHWVGEDLKVLRRVAAVQGNTVTLAVPLTDDFDARFTPGSPTPVRRVERTGLIAEVGVEDLCITAPLQGLDYHKGDEFDGIRMDNVQDAWIRLVHLEDTTNSVQLGKGSERITVQYVHVDQHRAVTSSAKNFMFSCNGTQVLFDRCSGKGDRVFYFATQSRQQGPVVILNSRFLGDGRIEPHQRWSTGLLVDSCDVPSGSIYLINRGVMGSGHGWAIGWSVLWNNTAGAIAVQRPPGALNWSIGDRGNQEKMPMPTSGTPRGPDLPQGVVDSPGRPVTPASLYLAQLRERLGDAALKATRYNVDGTPIPPTAE